jgi:hypothetical protein
MGNISKFGLFHDGSTEHFPQFVVIDDHLADTASLPDGMNLTLFIEIA